MPAGFDVTVPLPETFTDNTGMALKLALTDCEALIDTVQIVEEPLQAPLHPLNTQAALGAAVSVTLVPGT